MGRGGASSPVPHVLVLHHAFVVHQTRRHSDGRGWGSPGRDLFARHLCPGHNSKRPGAALCTRSQGELKFHKSWRLRWSGGHINDPHPVSEERPSVGTEPRRSGRWRPARWNTHIDKHTHVGHTVIDQLSVCSVTSFINSWTTTHFLNHSPPRTGGCLPTCQWVQWAGPGEGRLLPAGLGHRLRRPPPSTADCSLPEVRQTPREEGHINRVPLAPASLAFKAPE